MSKKVLIIGGVAGGASAAARLRRLDESAEIIMFEKGEYISFANCGLPYYIGEVIKEKEKLVVQTPEKMKERFNIDVRISSEVVKINREKKEVEVLDKVRNFSYVESYDKLILSPGAEPIRPKLPGIDMERIFTLRNIPDTYRIKEFVDSVKPKKAVVVGAGFIGLEMAENLHVMGINVTVVELADHVIGPLDFEMAAIVHQHLKTKGVELFLKDAVKSFASEDTTIDVELSSGKVLKTDMVIMGIGVRPETKLAVDAGLKLGPTGGIAVDEYMQTSDPAIYAVGDAVEVRDFIYEAVYNTSTNSKICGGTVLNEGAIEGTVLNEGTIEGTVLNEGTIEGTVLNNIANAGVGAVLIPLAGPANKQGRIVADNISGQKQKYNGTQGTSIVKVFDITIATTGSNEKSLTKYGIEFEKTFIHTPSHASYYPGAIPLSIKLLFGKKDGKVLGSQIIGYDGVDKRIDVIATAIRAGMSVYDLKELELAYAPPYSSAKDPVNIAGFTAANILKGDQLVFHWNEVGELDKSRIFLLDVRTKMEYNLGTIEGATNIPVDELRTRSGELPADKDIYLFCQVGLRGYVAARMLMQKGFKSVRNLSGGYLTYHQATQKQSSEGILHQGDYNTKRDSKSEENKGDLIKSADCGSSECGKPAAYIVNACGLQCPGPVLKVYDTVKKMEFGDMLEVKATDPAFQEDIKSWCESTGNQLISIKYENKIFTAVIKKEESKTTQGDLRMKNDKTLVVFSGELDKAIATFIIANGAAAMGRKVTLFFTFWGLNILRKTVNVKGKKDFMSKMFGLMMPRGSKKLRLSNMNMGGIGPLLIRYLMRKKNVASLEELMNQAKANGVQLIACNMSMDLMGITKEELIEGVTIGGVAKFLGSAEDSNMSLFV